YARWLLERHGSLQDVNRSHREVWSRPEEIEPPRRAIGRRAELIRYLDWFEYKLALINDYVEFLHGVVADAGVDVPLSMLYPYFLPASAVRMTELARRLSLQLTNECYPALFSAAAGTEQKVGAIVACHEAYHMWRGADPSPAVTMELQGSNASYLPAEAMELLYALTVARGIRGVNYYMMVGGANPPGYENGTGAEYDISAPIGREGSIRPHYPVISKLSEMVRAWIGDCLDGARPRRDVWLASYVPYEAALLSGAASVAGLEGFGETFDMGGTGLSEAPSLAALLALNSVSFGYLDLESAGPIDPAEVPQLWVPGGGFLDRAVQAELDRYVRSGGHLILAPALPALDAELVSCETLVGLALGDGWAPAEMTTPTRRAEVGVIRTEHGETLVASGPVAGFEPSGTDGGRPIARRGEDGQVCGFEVTAGDGRLTMLGWQLRYAPTAGPGQHAFTVRLAESGGRRRTAWTSGPPCCALQLAGRRGELLCVANPVELPCTTVVHYTLAERPGGPDGGTRGRLPLLLDGLTLHRRGARLLPLALQLDGGLCLRHSTWELVGLDTSSDRATLVLDVPEAGGNATAPRGELALTGPARAVSMTGGRVVRNEHVADGARVLVVEAHDRRVKVELAPPDR
ncbi:MAG: beta-galactosidase, partial [Acidimicrobiales bacterium]